MHGHVLFHMAGRWKENAHQWTKMAMSRLLRTINFGNMNKERMYKLIVQGLETPVPAFGSG